eukprot:Nitzschia sp. Nitz4//scaffold41_size133979//2584//3282//NITZ4_003323-RA/size133979-processed-gene-0.233-mRNA-1//-1//CDS//3329551398//4099//frame0
MEQQAAAGGVFQWPPLESDPGIFTDYLHKVGLAGEWQVGECFGLDDDCLGFIPQPCVAMIVNAERLGRDEDKERGDPEKQVVYYMKQSPSLDNACGIIACIHAIFNNQDKGVSFAPDSILGRFWEAVKEQNPEDRCTSLENAHDFKEIHKGYAMQGQSNLASDQSEVRHHFTAFVLTADKQLIELDGTKRGPLVVAENVDSVTHGTAEELQRRIREGIISESLSVMTLVKES